jgi:hypothetical protein
MVDGMERAGQIGGFRSLTKKADNSFNFVLDNIDEDGYIGPKLLKESKGWNRWPHVVFFRALLARYSATKIEHGDAAGYRTTELTYAGDLISSIGESLTSILDKIKAMLGAFEYFYDLDGRFIFQAKKIYSNNSWNTLVEADDNVFARDSVEETPFSYSFEDVNLVQ